MTNDAAPPETIPEPAPTPPAGPSLERVLTELEHRVHVLENTLAGLQDTKQLEERITERVVTRMPKPSPAPPVDPTVPPALRDISLPLPNAATVTTVVQSSWMIWELSREAKNMFWMLVDRRYHMAWLTRFFVIVLLVLIFASSIWVPLAKLEYVGYYIDKLVVVLMTLLMSLVLARETRRYKEWRAGRV